MALVHLFILMMLIQVSVSLWEARRTQAYFQALNRQAPVLVGKDIRRLGRGTLVFFVLDADLQVTAYHLRQGITAWAPFRVVTLTQPLPLAQLDCSANPGLERARQMALAYLPEAAPQTGSAD